MRHFTQLYKCHRKVSSYDFGHCNFDYLTYTLTEKESVNQYGSMGKVDEQASEREKPPLQITPVPKNASEFQGFQAKHVFMFMNVILILKAWTELLDERPEFSFVQGDMMQSILYYNLS